MFEHPQGVSLFCCWKMSFEIFWTPFGRQPAGGGVARGGGGGGCVVGGMYGRSKRVKTRLKQGLKMHVCAPNGAQNGPNIAKWAIGGA